MKRGSSTHAILGAGLFLTIEVTLAFGKSDPADPKRCLNAVREFADEVLKCGWDPYGPRHGRLFVDGLKIHTREQVKRPWPESAAARSPPRYRRRNLVTAAI